MKFGKEFAPQMVPEWHEAYMNYNHLKGMLKNILRISKRNAPSMAMASTPKGSLKRRLTLYRAISGLTGRQRGSPMTNSNEDEVILIREEEKEGSERLYQTMFLKSGDEGGELEFLFFRKLDDEFNKVNSFYSTKVKQVMEEAEELNNQMNALIALRVKVDKVGGFRNLDSNGPSTSNTMEHHVNDESHSKFHHHLDVIQEVEMSSDGHVKDESGNRAEQTASKISIRAFIPPSLRILDHVKINLVEPETPV